jgi:hypothetical protein
MGRAARTKHERRQVARWAQAAELAQRADQAADHVIAHCLAQAFGRTGALDLGALRSLRAQVAQRTAWPSWSWLPNAIFVQDLLATNGIDIDQTDDAELEKYCRLAAAMTTVVNWLPGRTVVYYDTTLLDSLANTPIEQPIPAQALYRLHAWGLYLDLPWLVGGAGVFACLDPGPDLHTTHVLLTYTGVLADGVPLEHELILANDMVPGSLSPPFADVSPDVAHFVPDELGSVVGMPWGRVLANTVSMLLYLCSEGPDVRRVALPPGPGAKRAAANSAQALQVGWRIGAALRAAQRYRSATRGEETDRHVLPHLRRPHCLVNSAAVSLRPVRGNCECGQRLYPHRGLRVA